MNPAVWASPQALKRAQRYLYMAFGLALLAFVVLQQFSPGPISPLPQKLQTVPLRLGAWEGVEEGSQSGWHTDIVTALGVDDWILRRYRHPAGGFVWFYVGYYANSLGFTKHHSPLICYPANGWSLSQSGVQPIALSPGMQVRVKKLVVQKGMEQRLVLYWHQLGNTVVPGNLEPLKSYGSKLSALLQVLRGVHRADRALVRISAPVEGDIEATLARELDFIRAVLPVFTRQFAMPAPR